MELDHQIGASVRRQPTHLTALFIGDSGYADFQSCLCVLETDTHLVRRPNAQGAISVVAEGLLPDLIVFGQRRRGQIREQDVEQLHALAPLARLVTVLSSWCEGETRSGKPLSGVIRMLWHQFVARFEGFRSGENLDWTLPRTSNVADRTLSASFLAAHSKGWVGVYASTRIAYEGLAMALQADGYEPCWLDDREEISGMPVDAPLAIVVDGLDPQSGQDELGMATSRFPEIPLLAVMGFPRKADVTRACRLGASWVVAKPMDIADLLEPLAQLTTVAHREAA